MTILVPLSSIAVKKSDGYAQINKRDVIEVAKERKCQSNYQERIKCINYKAKAYLIPYPKVAI